MGTSNRYIRIAKNGDDFYGYGSVVQGHNPTLEGLAKRRDEAVFKQVGTWREITEPGKPMLIVEGESFKTEHGHTVKVVSARALWGQRYGYAGLVAEPSPGTGGGRHHVVVHFTDEGEMMNSSHLRFGRVQLPRYPATTRLALIDEDGNEVKE